MSKMPSSSIREGGSEGADDHVSSKQAKRSRYRSSNSDTNSLDELSRALAWILRHKAVELGLSMTADGYVQVQEILDCQHPRIRGRQWNSDHIREVVEADDKQRYKLKMKLASEYSKEVKDENDNSYLEGNVDTLVLCIRANQGHSISKIQSNLLLNELSPDEVISLPIVVHGTFKDVWEKFIRVDGLSRMKRNHIHFATGLPNDGGVISGMRKSCQVFIYIDVSKCAEDKVKFFRSENGVILCSGVNDDGILPPSYFKRVTDATGKSLMEDSQI